MGKDRDGRRDGWYGQKEVWEWEEKERHLSLR
jgi:hypothetical protein